MNRSDLIRDMKSYCGGSFITRQKLAQYIGMKDPHGVDRFLYGLERIDGRHYFIPDVAEVLKSRCSIS